jgi:hypothetical protein
MNRKWTVMTLLGVLATAAVSLAVASQFQIPVPNFDRQIRDNTITLFSK